MAELMLKVSDLHASYGAVSVLRGLDFEVPEGEVPEGDDDEVAASDRLRLEDLLTDDAFGCV